MPRHPGDAEITEIDNRELGSEAPSALSVPGQGGLSDGSLGSANGQRPARCFPLWRARQRQMAEHETLTARLHRWIREAPGEAGWLDVLVSDRSSAAVAAKMMKLST